MYTLTKPHTIIQLFILEILVNIFNPKKVQVGKDQEKAQSEKRFPPKKQRWEKTKPHHENISRRQRSGKGAIRKRFPLQKPRWEKTKPTISYSGVMAKNPN